MFWSNCVFVLFLLILLLLLFFFFFNDTATTEIYTLSLHDALPIRGHAWHGNRSLVRSDSRAPSLHRAREPSADWRANTMREGKRAGVRPGWDIAASRGSLAPHGPKQSAGHSASLPN